MAEISQVLLFKKEFISEIAEEMEDWDLMKQGAKNIMKGEDSCLSNTDERVSQIRIQNYPFIFSDKMWKVYCLQKEKVVG